MIFFFSHGKKFSSKLKQTFNQKDSPLEGNRKSCTAHGITRPSITCQGGRVWLPHPDLARAYPRWVPLARSGVPSFYLGRDLGPVTGVPPRKDLGPVEVLWDEDGVPTRRDMGPIEVLRDGGGVPPCLNRHTTVKT